MIERLIHMVLADGIAGIARDDQFVRRYFEETRGLSREEIDVILKVFAEEPPDVVHNYPRADGKIPMWCIVLSNEAESQQFLGDEGGIVGELPDGTLDDGDPDAGDRELASVWDSSYMVISVARNPDVTLYFYYIARLLLTRQRGFLKSQGLANVTFSGSDIAPDPRFIPAGLFARQFTLAAKQVEVIASADVESRFHVVDGIFPANVVNTSEVT